MFKTIASLDWKRAGKGVFVTLTFPDEVWPKTKDERLRAMAEWFRKMERFLGKKVGAIWRVEWEERLTGTNKGKFLPHFHLIIFSVGYIPYRYVNLCWKESLRHEGYVRTEIKRLGNEKKTGYYVSKYCAKVPPLSSLVSVAYSRIDGKHWGYYRIKLLPRSPKRYFSDLSLATVEKLRNTAVSCLPWYDKETDAGFCIMGEFGRKLSAKALQFLLDNEIEDG